MVLKKRAVNLWFTALVKLQFSIKQGQSPRHICRCRFSLAYNSPKMEEEEEEVVKVEVEVVSLVQSLLTIQYQKRQLQSYNKDTQTDLL